MAGLDRDRDLMGRLAIGRVGLPSYGLTTAAMLACVAALTSW